MSQENTNQKLVNYISRIAAEAGAAKAIEIYQAQEAERIKDNESKKFKNVKLLLKEYRNLRAYAENALCDASQINDLVIRELIGFSEYEKYKVESIKNQIVTTKTIMEHVQTMLDIYKIRCTSSVREDMQRLSEEERSVVLARRAYYREWKRKNADKVKDTTTRFFKKHAEKLTAEKENKMPSE